MHYLAILLIEQDDTKPQYFGTFEAAETYIRNQMAAGYCYAGWICDETEGMEGCPITIFI